MIKLGVGLIVSWTIKSHRATNRPQSACQRNIVLFGHFAQIEKPLELICRNSLTSQIRLCYRRQIVVYTTIFLFALPPSLYLSIYLCMIFFWSHWNFMLFFFRSRYFYIANFESIKHSIMALFFLLLSFRFGLRLITHCCWIRCLVCDFKFQFFFFVQVEKRVITMQSTAVSIFFSHSIRCKWLLK